MRINLIIDVEETKSTDEVSEEIRDILRKTADYQDGTISVDNGLDSWLNSLGPEVWLDISQCKDHGHTRRCVRELFDYIMRYV